MEINTNSKAQVIELVEKEGLIGVMNNTKWNKLFDALNEFDELISFRATYIDGSTFPESDASFPFTSELAQIWGNFKALEYVEINTQTSYSEGALLKPTITYHSDQVISICAKQNAKFSLTENGIKIWGYFRHGQLPELHT